MRAMGLRANVHRNPDFDMFERAFQSAKIRERISVFKPTQDDWYPAFQLNGWYEGEKDARLVEVSFLKLLDGQWRVCVWGADDYGLEQDFTDQGAAYEIFEYVIGQKYVNKQWLIDRHFVEAFNEYLQVFNSAYLAEDLDARDKLWDLLTPQEKAEANRRIDNHDHTI